MEPPFSALKNLARSIRRKVLPRRIKDKNPFYPGLPECMNYQSLETVVAEHFQSIIRTVSHQHLSGWKESGAFRLRVNTTTGKEINLIFKNAMYSEEQIPALIDLPILPGPPEYTIHCQTSEKLANFLPQVYLAQEVIPNQQYYYLLEDLHQNYRRTFGAEDVISISALLPRFHQALSLWSKEINQAGLIQYGLEFSHSIEEYARKNLDAFGKAAQNATVDQVLQNWAPIMATYQRPDFFSIQPLSLIHGDTNYTNIHIYKKDPTKIKVLDWEWAGYGFVFADLVSLLKGSPEELEEKALRIYLAAPEAREQIINPGTSFADNQRLYTWCKLERGLLDASFLAAQQMNSGHQAGFNLTRAVTQALTRVLAAHQQLSF